MTEPRDELLERYADAAAQDPRGPSERVRNAVRAHAQMLRDQTQAEQQVEGAVRVTKPAANQSQWTVSLVASLAVVGFAGLIFLQIDRGTPEVREAGLSAAVPSATVNPTGNPTVSPTVAVPAPTPAKSVAIVDARKAVLPSQGLGTSTRTGADADAARQDRSAPAAEAHAVAKSFEAQEDRVDSPKSFAAAAPAVIAAPAPMPAETATATAAPAAANIAAPPSVSAPQRARMVQAPTPTARFLEAARNGNTETLQLLLTQGVDINSREDAGNTALLLAVRHRQTAVVRLLLSRGADRRLVNHDGMNALQLANQLGLADLVQLLEITP